MNGRGLQEVILPFPEDKRRGKKELRTGDAAVQILILPACSFQNVAFAKTLLTCAPLEQKLHLVGSFACCNFLEDLAGESMLASSRDY